MFVKDQNAPNTAVDFAKDASTRNVQK